MNSENLKISVVVNTCNRRDILCRTLPTVLDQTFPAWQREVIVVVDGSTDGTLEYVSSITPPCTFRVIDQPNQGPAAARNAGLKAAQGEVVLFLDDDVLCPKELIELHLAAHVGSKPLVAFGAVTISEESKRSVTAVWKSKHRDRTYARLAASSLAQNWMCANRSVPKSVIESLGGWDESFRLGEDADLGIRMAAAGIGFLFLPEATVYEIYSKSDDDLIREAIEFGRVEVRLARLHPSYRELGPLPLRWNAESRIKRLFTKVARVFPAEDFLRPIYSLTGRVTRSPLSDRIATTILDARAAAATLKGVEQESRSWHAYDREFGIKLPSLLFHHVGPGGAGIPDLSMSCETFERHIKWLVDSGFTSIRLSDWQDWRAHGRPLPRKPVLLTFDDAFADVAKFALPILKRYGLVATTFVPTGLLGGCMTIEPTDRTGETHECFSPASQPRVRSDRTRLMLPIMTASEIRKWAAEGFEFGSHSRTHINLNKVSQSDLIDEVVRSRDELHDITGSPVLAFAYPYGYYNASVVELVRSTYSIALSIENGLNTLATDVHLMRRLPVSALDGLISLKFQMATGKRPGQFIPKRIKKLEFVRRLANQLP